MKREAKLTNGPVGTTLLFMSLSMMIGTISTMIFNLVDTLFVSRLGTRALAAMSFTFPVVFVLGSFAMGLGIGAASVVSRTIGRRDGRGVRRMATDSLGLSFLVVAAFSMFGLLTIDPLFSLLGAGPETLPLVRDYMRIWYLGIAFLVIPMVGNNLIRATGDTKIPALIMLIGAVVNTILDPLFIFGLLGFPRMGLAGAALATVIGRLITCAAALSVLHFRERMLDFSRPRLGEVFASWKRVLAIGIPAATSNVMLPVAMGVATRLAAGLGKETVAAFGAGTRVTLLSAAPLMAMGASLLPVMGQNWGARLYDRVERGRQASNLFALAWGALITLLLWICAYPIARLFSSDVLVVQNIMLFLRVVPVGYGFQGIFMISNAALNGINRPKTATILMVIRLFVFFIPLTFLGTMIWKALGLFAGIALANIASASVSFYWLRSLIHEKKKSMAGSHA